MVDPFWERVFWLLLVSGIAGIGWVARSILKPWSDAALMKSQAFTNLVTVLEHSIPAIKEELDVLKQASKESNIALQLNTVASNAQTKKLEEHIDWWREMGSDPFRNVCKVKPEVVALIAKARGLSAEQVEEILTKLPPAKS